MEALREAGVRIGKEYTLGNLSTRGSPQLIRQPFGKEERQTDAGVRAVLGLVEDEDRASQLGGAVLVSAPAGVA